MRTLRRSSIACSTPFVVALACAFTVQDAAAQAAPSATVTLSPPSLDFGSLPVGTTSPTQTVTITSTGGTAYQIRTFDSNALCYGGPFCYGGDFTCSTTCSISPTSYGTGMSCQVNASFRPSFFGTQSTTIYFCDNTAGGSTAITLVGDGVPQPPVMITPSAFDFGNVLVGARSQPHSFFISNPGTVDTDIQPVGTLGEFTLDSTTCGPTVAAGTGCSAVVTFAPTQPGPSSGYVFAIPVPKSAAKFTLASVATLSGMGVQFAQLELPPSVDFGAYVLGAAPILRTVTLRNTGNAVLTFSSISASAPFTVANNCPVNLAPGESCTVNAGFSATASGDFNGTLNVDSNAQGGSRSISLTAHAQLVATPLVHVTPTFIGYGSRMFGTQSEAQRFTIANDGGAPATLSPLGVGLDYLITGTTCGAALASQATCTADVAFRPLGFGPRPGQFTFTSNSANSPHSVDMLGTGCRPFTVSSRGATSACAP